jgi:hypothetical protein
MTEQELLEQELDRIANYQPDVLISRSSLGSINFKDIGDIIQQTVSVAQELKSLPLNLLPEDTISKIRKVASELATRLGRVRDFTIETSSNLRSDRDNLAQDTKEYCQKFFNEVITFIPYLILNKPDFQKFLQSTDLLFVGFNQRIDAEVADLQAKIDDKVAEVETALQNIRDATAQLGVTQHAVAFKKAADDHASASKLWLTSTAAIVAITITVAIFILYEFPTIGDFKDATVIQRIIARLVIISILYYTAIWSAKNYRAHRHLSVLNAHRQHALETFQSFVEGAKGDEQTKNAVLLEATRCIFTTANTGYLGAEDENPTSRVIEILKTVSSSAGK